MAKHTLTNSRYTDLTGEPVARLLSPIKGYEAVPLASLEQSITPITHLFDGIEENVWIAKENSKIPPDDLTHDESAAIHLYTMQFDGDPSFYQLLNSTLRGENRDNLKPWFSYLKLFMTALHKLPSQPQTLWRGVRGVDLSKQYPTGTKFAWWGVSSCTTNVEVLQAETFLGRKGMRTLFSIESRNGKSIAPHSYFKETEKEVVLMPGSYFEVIGQLNPADDLYIIQMKELDPPFPFVKPPFKRELSKPPDNVVLPVLEKYQPKQEVSSNESASSTTAADVVKEAARAKPPASASEYQMVICSHSDMEFFILEARIFSSSVSPQMQDAIIKIMREAIDEGTDDEDIKSIIVSELIQRFGGNWWAHITPMPTTYKFMDSRPFLAVKIGDYNLDVLRQ